MGTGGESQTQNVRELIVVAVVAAVFSSFTLWLIDSWIKYPLFLFETLTIIVLYLILSNYTIKLTMKNTRTDSLNAGLIIDACFMVSALGLLIINVVGIQAGLLQLVLAFLCTSLLSGYALLNVVGLSESFSTLEVLVFSYIVSFASSSILFLFLLPLNLLIRPIILSVFFLALGSFSMIKHLKQPRRAERESLCKPIDALPLIIAVFFYVIAFFFMYPNYALLPGTDPAVLFSNSVVLNRTPQLYISFNYFFFNLFQASLYSLSTPSIAAFLSSLQILNWVSPLVFYVMAKEHLESIDKRLPSIATVFWALFSNLGWLYFVDLKLTSNVQSELQLISMTAGKTIFGPILASFGLEYTPIVVSFIMLLVLIYLLKRFDIPAIKYIALFSIITAAMYLTHPVEVTVFALFLALYGIFSRGESLRVNDSLKASLLGFLMAGAVYIALPTITVRFTLTISTLLSIITPILSLSLALCLRRSSVHIPRLKIRQQLKISWAKVAIVGLLFFYAVAFLTWASSAGSFNMSASGAVPLYFYPLMLGITGLLSLLALFQILGDKALSKLLFFVAFIFCAIIAGRIVSFLNINFFDTGYWEYRFLTFAVIGTSILAPIAIVKFASSWRASSRSVFKTLGVCLLISVITLCGISSSFLGLEYWHTVSNEQALMPSSEEFAALNYMKTVFNADPRSWLVTVTTYSYDTDQFAAPADQMLAGIPVLFTAENPEVPLYMLYRSPYLSHPYLYMDSRDEVSLQDNYEDGYMAQHLIPMLPSAFQNQEVTVYNISQVAPPTTTSETALVVPFDESAFSGKPYLYAYNILSQGLYNYTVAYDLDDKLMQKNTLILSFDPPTQSAGALRNFNDYINYVQSGGTLIVLNTNGYGGFAESLFSPSNGTLEAEAIKTSNETLQLPANVEASILNLKSDDTETLSNYTSALGQNTVYAVKESLGKGQLFYVNLYPLINHIEIEGDQPSFYNILGKLLEAAGLNLGKCNLNALPATVSTFEEAELSGTVEAESNSILFPLQVNIPTVEVTANGENSTFNNVTSLSLSNYEKITVKTAYVSISQGQGLYAVLTLNETTQLTPAGNDTLLTLTANDEQFELSNLTDISLVPENPLEIYAYTPSIKSSGNASLTDLTIAGTLNGRQISGQNLEITGVLTFDTYLSDTYTLVENIKVEGSFNTSPPTITYDEWSVLPTAAFWSLILLPIFIGAFIVFHGIRRVRTREDSKTNRKDNDSDTSVLNCPKTMDQYREKALSTASDT
jgi:hypothetical protein